MDDNQFSAYAESERLEALRSLNILDTSKEPQFDRITRLAADIFQVPIALISLVDQDRQWFKSCFGLTVSGTARDISFCTYAIRSDEAFIVPDATKDEVFRTNPLVTGDPWIRFYAGYPIRSPDGFKIGTLCVIDRRPRLLDDREKQILADLASSVESELLLHSIVGKQSIELKASRKLDRFFELSKDYLCICAVDGFFKKTNPTWSRELGFSDNDFLSTPFLEFVHPDDRIETRDVFKDVDHTGHIKAFENRYICRDGTVRWLQWNAMFSAEEKLFYAVARDTTTALEMSRKLAEEQARSEALISSMLPKKIAARLKGGTGLIADKFEDVTVMFVDICSFTHMSKSLLPSALVLLLNEIFSTFDALVRVNGLEKIKTIGDAYMVAAGLTSKITNHAEAIAELALEMRAKIKQFNGKSGRRALQLRYGINTGPVIAGVIGTEKLTYDIWGDAVNVASRMESHGEPDVIYASEATFLRLQGKFNFEAVKTADIRGYGLTKMYALRSKR